MKIFFLRHEKRPLYDPTFYTELTEEGKKSAKTSLKEKLLKYNFTHIYCSPFIRTLQTIQPYLKETNKLVNIENGFMEGLHDYAFKFKTNVTLPENLYNEYNVNPNYKSIYPVNKCHFYESRDDINNRIKITLDYIKTQHANTNDKILICTHKCICNFGLGVLLNKARDKDEVYNMGTLSTTIGNKVYFL